MVRRFEECCQTYYDRILPKKVVATLSFILSRKMNRAGGFLASTGSKDVLLGRIHTCDLDVIRALYTKPSPVDIDLLESLLNYDPIENNPIVCHFDNFEIRKNQFECGRSNYTISLHIMSAFMSLFQKRDKQQCDTFNLINRNKSRRKYSYYFDPAAVDTFCSRNIDINQPVRLKASVEAAILQIDNLFTNYHHLYFPIYNPNGKVVELIIVDFSDKKIIFIDPSQPDDEHHKTLNMQRMNELVTPLKIFLQSLPNCPETLGNFPSEIQSYNTLPNYSFRSYDRLSINNQDNAGVYLLIILELIYHDAPLVFFSSDMDIFRTYYFSCLLKCEIPQVSYSYIYKTIVSLAYIQPTLVVVSD
jgi:hypothetical protein